jgi:hypothetical protein
MLLPLAVLALLVEPVVALSLSAAVVAVMLLPLVFLVEQVVALSLSAAEVVLLPLVFLVVHSLLAVVALHLLLVHLFLVP